jgi:ATP-dependent protease Clp ATPase subunit
MLIAGIDGHICETCVEQAFDIISDELKVKKQAREILLEIIEQLLNRNN